MIEEIFKMLDNKFARVECGNMEIAGTMEQICQLEFIQHRGLRVSVPIEYNDCDIIGQVNRHIIESSKNNISYDQRDKILNVLNDNLKHMYIKVGMISCYGIKDINIKYNKDVISNASITYDDGSIIKLRCIKS